MRVHNIEWFKNNCWYGNKNGRYGYFYLNKFGYLPDEGIEICGKLYKIIGGFKIRNILIYKIQLPEWFIEKNVLEIE